MTDTTPVQAAAYAEAADRVREAAEYVAEAEVLVIAARDDLSVVGAHTFTGDLARLAFELGDQGDAEIGPMERRLALLALRLHERGSR